MSGRKDCLSIARNIYKQKILILCNLKDLFNAFKMKCPKVKIGFLTFASLCLKWCTVAGASGTHSVCLHYTPEHRTAFDSDRHNLERVFKIPCK